MPTGVPNPTTAAFSPAGIRNALRARVQVPEGMLNDALKKVHANLEAKEKKFFSFQGSVVDTREVEALTIQQQAAELIVRMAELVTTGAAKPSEPRVEVVIDAKTGTMRIVIGEAGEEDASQLRAAASAASEAETFEEHIKKVDAASTIILTPTTNTVPSTVPQMQPEPQEAESEEEEQMEVVKVPRGTLPQDVRNALFGDGASEPTVGSG